MFNFRADSMKKSILTLLFTTLFSLSIFAQDYTYLYLGSTEDGTSGLIAATSDTGTPDGKWSSKDLETPITTSDYGSWGSGKKMFEPSVYYNESDSTWILVFNTYKDGSVQGTSKTKDFIRWSVQEYRTPDQMAAIMGENTIAGKLASININGLNTKGSILKVPTSVVNNIKLRQKYVAQRNMRNGERSAEDSWRFSGCDTLHISLVPDENNAHKISDKFIGIFFEDINYAADGGLYAELIQNRDFEYDPSDRRGDQSWNATRAWALTDSSQCHTSVETTQPIHQNNPHYLRLVNKGSKGALVNEGYDGIPVQKGETYKVSLFVRSTDITSLKIALTNPSGHDIGQCKLSYKPSGEWIKIEGVIKATATCDNATLTVTPQKRGAVDLDLISLMPQNTFKNRPNGLRKDLAQVLAELHPRFVRFPGGCVAHGDGIDNMYDWKGSIGRLEERIGKHNIWGYHQTRGLGYHEYFEFCEDIGAEPLPVLAAGVPCQNSSSPSHYSHDHLTTDGQQCGIPMEDMGQYIQDILDLIEYANGDISTTWGARRAQNGHPATFNLKMIGIGNEDLISETFKERFLLIHNAIKEKYPQIEVIGTVGPFYEGSDYETGWQFATKNNLDAVDEHYYVSPGWYIHNRGFYDNYDPDGPKVYLGEYASHLPGRVSTLEAALSIALYLTEVERHGDIVTMTSYAPLLAKKGHTQWRPDLIYFDNTSIHLTPDYYVQKMYGTNAGTIYIPSLLDTGTSNTDINDRLAQSIVIDNETEDIIVRLINMTPMTVVTTLPYSSNDVTVTTLSGNPLDTDVVEHTVTTEIKGTYNQAPYSFTVLRFKNLK